MDSKSDEKRALVAAELPSPAAAALRQRSSAAQRARTVCTTLLLLAAAAYMAPLSWHIWTRIADGLSPSSSGPLCEQYCALAPPSDKSLDANRDVIFSDSYREKSAGILSGIVRIHSESWDDLGAVGEDPRWDRFFDIEAYLKKTFPEVHEHLTLDVINTHGLLYTLQGSDKSLKPLMLAAHQDVVPVNSGTLDDWTYPPWDGVYDGKYMWGRGAGDCKNMLTAELEAITLLLKAGFEPKRTVLLAYGFDEESKGYNGAGELAKYIEHKHGKDSMLMIVDEGGLGIGDMWGAPMALPATGEKGYVDVNITLKTPGGHSSAPPPHTNIGMLSTLITQLEEDPYKPSLSQESPIFSMLECISEHGELPTGIRKSVDAGGRTGKVGEVARKHLAHWFASLGNFQRFLVQTSQAVDIIGGGIKINALPETSFTTVNHRIAVDSEVADVKAHITGHLVGFGHRFNLNVTAFGEKVVELSDAAGSVKSVAINELEPAPISQTSQSEKWKLLASTIKHSFDERFGDLIVSPSVMTGNTDTRFYWDLSSSIFRFTPMDRSEAKGIHTVDEHILFDDHIGGVWFFHELIRNADASGL